MTFKWERGKYFIGNDRARSIRRNVLQSPPLVLFEKRSGRIIGCHGHDGPRPVREVRSDGVRVDVPFAVVAEVVRNRTNVVAGSQDVEQRIPGTGDENFIPLVAEKAKQEGIGFACRGGQDDRIGIDR